MLQIWHFWSRSFSPPLLQWQVDGLCVSLVRDATQERSPGPSCPWQPLDHWTVCVCDLGHTHTPTHISSLPFMLLSLFSRPEELGYTIFSIQHAEISQSLLGQPFLDAAEIPGRRKRRSGSAASQSFQEEIAAGANLRF